MLSTPQNSDPLTGSAWAAEKMKHPIKKNNPVFWKSCYVCSLMLLIGWLKYTSNPSRGKVSEEAASVEKKYDEPTWVRRARP